MKSTSKLIIFITLLALAASAYAQSPREQLQQMVEQLQKTPNDNALRARIIKLGAEIKPAPAIPEEAERRMARGEAAFERAKEEADYANAVSEFQAAATAAPWFATPYFNLGVAEEKANHPKEAMESFRWYLLAAPDAKDVVDVKKRLFKLEYAAEQQIKAAAVTAKQAETKALEQRISGAWKRPHALNDGVPRLEILYVRQASDGKWNILMDYFVGNKQVAKETPFGARDRDRAYLVVNGELRYKYVDWSYDNAGICVTYDVTGTVSADGNTLNLAYTLMPFAPDRPYGTCPLKSTHKSEVIAYSR